MSPRVRLLLGLVTTAVLCLVGATVLADGNTVVGGIILGLGAFRGIVWLNQVRVRLTADE